MRVWDISFLQILYVWPKPYNLAMCPCSPYESLWNPLFHQIYVHFMTFKKVPEAPIFGSEYTFGTESCYESGPQMRIQKNWNWNQPIWHRITIFRLEICIGQVFRTYSWVLDKFWKRLKNWQYYLLVIGKHIANFWELEAAQRPYHCRFGCWLDPFHSIVTLFSWVNSARLCNRPKNIMLLDH